MRRAGSRDIAPQIRGAFTRAALQLEEEGRPMGELEASFSIQVNFVEPEPAFLLVPGVGIEPTLGCPNQILSLLRVSF